MVDQTTLHQGYAGTKRPGSEVLHSEDEEHIVQTTKSKGIVNVQLFIRSKSKEVCFFFFFSFLSPDPSNQQKWSDALICSFRPLDPNTSVSLSSSSDPLYRGLRDDQ